MWRDLNEWRSRLTRAGDSREARTRVALDWGQAAGGTVTTTGETVRLHLPHDLPAGLAAADLVRLAVDLGLMPRVAFSETNVPTQPVMAS